MARKGRGEGLDGGGSVRFALTTLVVLDEGFTNNLTMSRKGGITLRAKDIAEEGTEVEFSFAMGFHKLRAGSH